MKNLKIVADSGFATNESRRKSEMPAFALIGGIYSINKIIDFSAGVKFGISKPETDLTGTFGITCKF